jgi:predicted dehydrogenase
MTKITPLILGSGRSGKAIAKSFAILNILYPQLQLAPPIFLKRNESLSDERKKYDRVLLGVSNPHGLHAQSILEADQTGFDAILCEKPACVNLEQVERLQSIKTPTAILHAYRQMWGPQLIKKMIEDGEFGELITIEGRYWHASAANAGLSPVPAKANWKNDVTLSGESDTYLDLGVHMLDAFCFLHGSFEPEIQGWRSYINASSPHRDTHIQVAMNFPQAKRAFGSISKTVHGSPNHFEINVIGSKKYAKWEFLSADEIHFGVGKDRSIITRREATTGSQQDPYHATGWLEGYIEIALRLINHAFHGESQNYPSLKENLQLLRAIFDTIWTVK